MHGEAGTTVGAAAVVRAGEGRTVRWGPAGVMRVIAGADSTDGSFCICESTEPVGSGSPLHVHHAEAEAFYVLEGTLELACGDETVTVGPGDFAYAPKDVPHRFTVIGEQAARVLLLFSRPGFESFFIEGGTPVDGPPAGPPDPGAMRQLAEKYDLEILGMPGH